jgi:hypothetical protein
MVFGRAGSLKHMVFVLGSKLEFRLTFVIKAAVMQAFFRLCLQFVLAPKGSRSLLLKEEKWFNR